MAKHQFEDFLMTVTDQYKAFVTTVHEMLQDAYKARIQSTKNGLSLSYSQPKTTWRLLGFSVRDKVLIVHVNTEHYAKYPDLLNDLPERIVNHIDQSPTCKKLIDPEKCWTTCEPGYDFYIGEKQYQKCRYSCFKLHVDTESIPFFLALIENEAKERRTS